MTTALVKLKSPRTKYQKTVIRSPRKPVMSTGLFVLKRADSNAKLGGNKYRIEKGPFRSLALYALTLQERATCPLTCANWNRCYGDNMPFAVRHQADTNLLKALEQDAAKLATKHPTGFVVRLHVLGDFPSVAYVEFWGLLLVRHPELHIFGYTHWPYSTNIGKAVTALVQEFAPRVSILRSDGDDLADPLPRAMTVEAHAPAAPGTVLCPEQTGRTKSCLTCGLCMNGRTSVSFIDHSRKLR